MNISFDMNLDRKGLLWLGLRFIWAGLVGKKFVRIEGADSDDLYKCVARDLAVKIQEASHEASKV